VIATDAAGNESEAQSVILEINDLDDAAPTITSGDTAITIDEELRFWSGCLHSHG
jgi:hypothetical protein